MRNLLKIIRSASPDSGVQFRRNAYGVAGIRSFLRDVIAIANAPVDDSRYIITGVEIDERGRKSVYGVSRKDFSGKPSYQSLLAEYVEPPIRIKYQPVNVDDKRVGVYQISNCQDRPYMMRVDHSEKLRRGDAYVRVGNIAVKMGRRLLQDMFEDKFRDSVSADQIEIGFPGEIIHKDFKIATTNLSALPSAVASAKLKQFMDIQKQSKDSGSTTVMARLTHARLFGSDDPYEDRTLDELIEEMLQIERTHSNEDNYFLFEKNAQPLQLVVYNQGQEPIEDASLSLVMPNHNEFYVASRLPRIPLKDKYVEPTPAEQAGYPAVNLKDDSIHVSNTLGVLPVSAPITAFELPLRLCVGSALKGRKLGIRYSLFGRNLRHAAKGTLRLVF